MSNNEKFIKIFVSFSVITKMKSIDFHTNICYTVFSTFKEGGLCIERLWAS